MVQDTETIEFVSDGGFLENVSRVGYGQRRCGLNAVAGGHRYCGGGIRAVVDRHGGAQGSVQKDLLFNAIGEQQMSAANVTFSPELSAFSPTDFSRASALIEAVGVQVDPVVALAVSKFEALGGGRRRTR